MRGMTNAATSYVTIWAALWCVGCREEVISVSAADHVDISFVPAQELVAGDSLARYRRLVIRGDGRVEYYGLRPTPTWTRDIGGEEARELLRELMEAGLVEIESEVKPFTATSSSGPLWPPDRYVFSGSITGQQIDAVVSARNIESPRVRGVVQMFEEYAGREGLMEDPADHRHGQGDGHERSQDDQDRAPAAVSRVAATIDPESDRVAGAALAVRMPPRMYAPIPRGSVSRGGYRQSPDEPPPGQRREDREQRRRDGARSTRSRLMGSGRLGHAGSSWVEADRRRAAPRGRSRNAVL